MAICAALRETYRWAKNCCPICYLELPSPEPVSLAPSVKLLEPNTGTSQITCNTLSPSMMLQRSSHFLYDFSSICLSCSISSCDALLYLQRFSWACMRDTPHMKIVIHCSNHLSLHTFLLLLYARCAALTHLKVGYCKAAG